MGLIHFREYDDIIVDFTEGILSIPKFYTFFEMTDSDWNSMSKKSKQECAKTLADDIFYGLSTEPSVEIGEGSIIYNENNKSLDIFINNIISKSIKL
jgi:hypothetical protein